jgi:hypothetical protein
LLRTPEGKPSLNISYSRWWNNIKIDLADIKLDEVNWINSIQEK